MASTRSASCRLPLIIKGLGDIAQNYSAAFCDVWGVLHDGRNARPQAVEALQTFRARCGPVVLLSNAPRPIDDVQKQFARLDVPDDCYDAILTSGVLAHDDLARRSNGRELKLLHIGPERDRGVFAGLPVRFVAAADAEFVVCTGLSDDETESPEDYRDLLTALDRRHLEFLCANPDIVVRRGGQLVYCAGALARLYAHLGGRVIYYGKPYAPIFDAALTLAREAAKCSDLRVLVLGDGLETDIRGANTAGLDTVFIAEGIHGEDLREITPVAIQKLCNELGVSVTATMRMLVW